MPVASGFVEVVVRFDSRVFVAGTIPERIDLIGKIIGGGSVVFAVPFEIRPEGPRH
jgi:hypothetical protein